MIRPELRHVATETLGDVHAGGALLVLDVAVDVGPFGQGARDPTRPGAGFLLRVARLSKAEVYERAAVQAVAEKGLLLRLSHARRDPVSRQKRFRVRP